MPKKTAAPKKKNAKKQAVTPNAGGAKRASSKKKAPKSSATNSDFSATFAGLRKVMAGVTNELRVTADEPQKFNVVTKSNSWRGGPMFFGAVMMGKAYVSYHIMALYIFPELTKTIPPGLKKRMQGKACFNFREPDTAVFAQLADVTEACVEKYRMKKLL